MGSRNDQLAPYPAELAALVAEVEYRPGWRLRLEDIDRDTAADGTILASGLTLIVTTKGFDSYHVERGETYRVNHYFPVPAATYNLQSWRRWLFDQLVKVELHEAMEFFAIGGERPFAPNHGPGFDPYVVRELTDDEARRTSFRGVVKADG